MYSPRARAAPSLGAVGTSVDDLGSQAGDALGGLEVLLVAQTHGVEELHRVPLTPIVIAKVVGGDAHFAEAQLPGPVLDLLADVFSGGLAGGFQVYRGAGSQDEFPGHLLVFDTDVAHLLVMVPQVIGPLLGSPFGDVDVFQGVLPGRTSQPPADCVGTPGTVSNSAGTWITMGASPGLRPG